MDSMYKQHYAYTKMIIDSIINNIQSSFKSARISNDSLCGFQMSELFLHFFEAFGCSPSHPKKLSKETSRKGLVTMLDPLSKWDPTQFCNSPKRMKLYSEMNLPNCFQIILNSIDDVSRRISDKLQHYEGNNEMDSYSNLILPIREHANRINNILQETFLPYNLSGTGSTSIFQLGIATVHKGVKLPISSENWSRFLVSHGTAAPTVIVAVNSPVADKLRQVNWSEVIGTSTDSICQICREDLQAADVLSTFSTCRHICCGPCVAEWFTAEKKCLGLDWRCPTCCQVIEELGTVYRNGTKVLQCYSPEFGTCIIPV